MQENVRIEQITRENYHLYDDMVSWRMSGREPTREEKAGSKSRDYAETYRELEHPGFRAYGALCEGRFVGWISLMYTPKIGRRRWKSGVIYIDELWVAPDYRRKGTGRRLIEKASSFREETGAVEVRVYVGDDNIPAQEAYRKAGLHAESGALYMKSDPGG